MRESGILRNVGCVRALIGFLPALTILGGIGMIVAGFVQAPGDERAAGAFANDPGCRVDLIAGGVPGVTAGSACRVVAVQVLDAANRLSGGVRSKSETPYARLSMPDGSHRETALAGDDGRAFVRQVYAGTPGRVLLFHGQVVRVAANGIAADARSAPGQAARSNAELPWIGAGLIAFGLFMFWAMRRAQRVVANASR